MRFRRPDSGTKEYPFAGTAGVMNGRDAVLEAARAAGDVVVVASAEATDAVPASGGRRDALEMRTASPREILALIAGLALDGVRASAIVEHPGAGGESLSAAAGKRLAFVVHLIARSRTRQAASSRGAHDEYHALADSGAFLMFARNVQEAADFSLIARRVAELSLTPGVCAQDLYQTSHSIQSMHHVSDALAHDYVGGSDDVIPCPNDAQSVVFGATRRRLPVLLDVDRPAGIGGLQDRESYFRAIVAGHPFFAAQVPALMDDAMRAFAERTGRSYQRVSGYRIEDADMVVVGQGAIMDELVAVVDHLRREKILKAGLVNVSVLRPFAGAALSHMLAGKRAVTVLERTDTPLADSPPLFQEVREAIDRATENGPSGDAPPYPDHATFRRIEDRPRLFSGVYGVGGDMPSFAELAAVFEHMAAKGGSRRFFVGARFDTETRRFPHLEALQQRLAREHSALETLSLKTSTLQPAIVEDGRAFQLRSLSMQGGMFAGNLFAQALADAMDWDVRTFPDGGLDRNLQPVSLTTACSTTSGAARTRPSEIGAVMVSGEHMIEALPIECALEPRGMLIVGSVQEPEALWRGLSRRAAHWVRNGEVRVHVLDARKIASETAVHASFIDQLAIWSLIGALARCTLSFDAETTKRVIEALRARLERIMGADAATIDAIAKAFARGGDEVREVPWTEWKDVAHAAGETDAPWTVRDGARHDGSVFDPVRFWNSVGYLYDRGQSAFTLADPYLATGVIPARSSAFRDLSRYRLRIPEWIPSACTGCAECWTLCPESAMPSTIRSLSELIQAAARECERTGGALVQMKRMGDALAKQAYQLARQQAPHPYESLTAILDDAFVRVVEKAGLAGDKLDALKLEFDRLKGAVDRLPVAVTERFFATPHGESAGSGRLLSIAINPRSCSACGVCVAACAEGAIAWTEQTPERLGRNHHDWNFIMQLPALPASVLAGFVREDDPGSSVLRLLDTAVYHSLVGGDGSFPGNGAKTAVHLVTAAIESEMRPRYAAHVERLSRLIERVEQRIQGTVDSTAKINDFEEFGAKLSRVAGNSITPDVLRSLASDSHGVPAVDAAHLARLTSLLQALKEQKRSYTEGDGRARMLLTIDPAPGAFWNGTYPYNPHPQPWVSHLSGDAAALARGVCDGVVRRLGVEFVVCRQAERELVDRGGGEATPAALPWAEFSADERRLVPTILVLADAAHTDMATLASVLESGMPIRVALIDHDGISMDHTAAGARSAGLPALRATGAATVFVVQSSIGYPGHLMHAVAESLEREAPALYRIYAPDAVSDGLPAEGIVDAARLAVESRAVPLFVVRPDGEHRGLSLEGNPDAQADWTSRELAVKEPSGAEGKIRTMVTVADWAARQARFRRHFTTVSRGNRSAQMKPLADHLSLAPDAREGFQPYIDVRDRDGRHALMLVSADMVRAAGHAADAWRELRDVARGIKPAAAAIEAAAVTGAPLAQRTDSDAVQTLADNLLRLSGYGTDETFFKRRLREFVAQPKGANGDAE